MAECVPGGGYSNCNIEKSIYRKHLKFFVCSYISYPNNLKVFLWWLKKIFFWTAGTDRRCSNYIWVIDNFNANLGASYIRDLTVYPLHSQVPVKQPLVLMIICANYKKIPPRITNVIEWTQQNEQYFYSITGNRMEWQWAEPLVEIRVTLADIRGTTK